MNLSQFKIIFSLATVFLGITVGCSQPSQNSEKTSGSKGSKSSIKNPARQSDGQSQSSDDPSQNQAEESDPKNIILITMTLSDINSTNFLNNSIAQPAGLGASYNYHVTLGFVENVPQQQANTISQDILAFLTQTRDLAMSPIPFDIGDATTFALLGSQNYRSRSVILVPQNPQPFKDLNQAIDNHIKTYPGLNLELDPPTSVPRYIPHVTLTTPPTRTLKTTLNNGIQAIRAILPTTSQTLYFDEYHAAILPSR